MGDAKVTLPFYNMMSASLLMTLIRLFCGFLGAYDLLVRIVPRPKLLRRWAVQRCSWERRDYSKTYCLHALHL